MKTVIVVYSDAKSLNKMEIGRLKKYSFNTEAELKEGDVIKSPQYETKMHVVKILDISYKFYNASTGEMSDEYKSTSQWEIRTLLIGTNDDTIIYGSIVK